MVNDVKQELSFWCDNFGFIENWRKLFGASLI